MSTSNSRFEKGQSLIAFPSEYIIIDLETTGLSPACDDIIEFGGIKVKDNIVVENFETLINPGYEIDDFITNLTGISNKMLADAPDISEALPKILSFISDSILIGHNVNFDINFLYDHKMHLLGSPLSNDFIDTMRIARKLYPEFKHHRLSDIAEYFNVSYAEGHRALFDCQVTNQVYNAMHDVISRNFETEEEFISLFKAKSRHNKLNARSITTDIIDFDVSHPLFGKVCVFTGTLEKMQRKDAMQLVVDHGGECGNGVTSKTNYLILGNNDYCSTIKDGKSSKQKKAESLRLAGNDIEIIPEDVFYDMIDY